MKKKAEEDKRIYKIKEARTGGIIGFTLRSGDVSVYLYLHSFCDERRTFGL